MTCLIVRCVEYGRVDCTSLDAGLAAVDDVVDAAAWNLNVPKR